MMRVVCAPGTEPVVPDVDLASVRSMAERFPAARLREVAVVRAQDLDTRDTRVWLALEALQVTGSFKVRGALVAMDARRKRGEKTFVTASAGNHGAGVAYAANLLGVPVTIVVPTTTPEKKKANIARYGADLLIHGNSYDEADDEARRIARETGAAYISAYDDVDVVLGNGASVGFEIVRALGGVPERVLAPFGGGGLCTGLAWAMADESMTRPCERTVWGVQTEASPAMAISLDQGKALERIETRPTLAEGLEGGISPSAFARARDAVAGVVVVSEASIESAMAHAYKDMGLVLEGTAAAALAPLLDGLPAELEGGDLVCVLTGRNVDVPRLDQALEHATKRA
jgi:threonine dehydratase